MRLYIDTMSHDSDITDTQHTTQGWSDVGSRCLTGSPRGRSWGRLPSGAGGRTPRRACPMCACRRRPLQPRKTSRQVPPLRSTIGLRGSVDHTGTTSSHSHTAQPPEHAPFLGIHFMFLERSLGTTTGFTMMPTLSCSGHVTVSGRHPLPSRLPAPIAPQTSRSQSSAASAATDKRNKEDHAHESSLAGAAAGRGRLSPLLVGSGIGKGNVTGLWQRACALTGGFWKMTGKNAKRNCDRPRKKTGTSRS
jgi:hypothetical protein